MKNTFFTPFKVGLVVLGSIVAFAMMYSIVNTELDTGEGTYQVHAIFDDVTGLALKSKIQLAGIRVGEVSNIELVGDRAKVTLELQRRVELKLGEDREGRKYVNGATVSKKQASLLGDYYLEITPGYVGPPIEPGQQIMNVPKPVGPDEIFERFDEIASDVKKVTESLANTFGSAEGQAALKNILTRLEEISTALATFLQNNDGRLDRIVENAEGITSDVRGMTRDARSDLSDILENARRITRRVEFLVDNSSGDVQDSLASLKTTLERLSVTLDEFNYALQNVGEITDKINEGEGTLGVLVNDPAIATETEEVLRGVGDFVGRIVELRTIVELRSEYLFRQSALKNYVSVRLQPTEDKYYLIELVDDTRGSTQLIQETRQSTDSSESPVVREDKVITTDDFKFSVLIAKRWGFFTGRFGLIESSGGLGGDLHFLDDNLEIKVDLFDFGEDVNPRLRTAIAYTFFQYIYFIGGTDDVLNDETRDFYFGLALRFNDEDLVTILSAAPAPSF